MPLRIVRNDLAAIRADAVVIPANTELQIDGGAGEAVARRAGLESLQEACDDIGGCPVGSAVATPAFDLPAKVIIHAVGPVWNGGASGELQALRSCIHEALTLAASAGAESVALPLMSAGSYGFPPDRALAIETDAIAEFLDAHEMDVCLVLYDRNAIRAGRALFDEIEEYIDDVYVGAHGRYERDRRQRHDALETMEYGALPFALEDAAPGAGTAAFGAPLADLADEGAVPLGLADRIDQLDESFARTVLRLIDERGMTDVEVYKRANMSRQLFAKIRKDDDYRPTKKTACALAVSLELDLDDAAALLERAGFALSHSSKFDIIIEYFLMKGNYDIFAINEALFAYDQPLLA